MVINNVLAFYVYVFLTLPLPTPLPGISVYMSNMVRRKKKKKHNTTCVGQDYAQTNANNVNKTRAFLQTNGNKDKPNIGFC
jgi:hypothetical protein